MKLNLTNAKALSGLLSNDTWSLSTALHLEKPKQNLSWNKTLVIAYFFSFVLSSTSLVLASTMLILWSSGHFCMESSQGRFQKKWWAKEIFLICFSTMLVTKFNILVIVLWACYLFSIQRGSSAGFWNLLWDISLVCANSTKPATPVRISFRRLWSLAACPVAPVQYELIIKQEWSSA